MTLLVNMQWHHVRRGFIAFLHDDIACQHCLSTLLVNIACQHAMSSCKKAIKPFLTWWHCKSTLRVDLQCRHCETTKRLNLIWSSFVNSFPTVIVFLMYIVLQQLISKSSKNPSYSFPSVNILNFKTFAWWGWEINQHYSRWLSDFFFY